MGVEFQLKDKYWRRNTATVLKTAPRPRQIEDCLSAATADPFTSDPRGRRSQGDCGAGARGVSCLLTEWRPDIVPRVPHPGAGEWVGRRTSRHYGERGAVPFGSRRGAVGCERGGAAPSGADADRGTYGYLVTMYLPRHRTTYTSKTYVNT